MWLRRSWFSKWVLKRISGCLLTIFGFTVVALFYLTENFPSKDAFTLFSNNDRDLFLKKMKAEMENRRKVIEEVCLREGLGRFAKKSRKQIQHPPTPNYEAFYFDRKDRLAWCPIYKCASTSWLYNLCILAGLTDKDIKESKIHISTLARKLYPNLEFEDGEKAMNASQVKFLIVRDPFQRILSAYRDKLENKDIGKKHGTLHFYKSYGSKIVKKYRKKANKLNKENDSNFPDRYKQIIEENVPQDRPEPTFKEFVMYLTDTNLLIYGDDHWMPYYVFCTPCFIQYDVIAKFETLEDDQKYLIKLARLEDNIKPEWKHLTKGQQTSQVIKKYYSKIPKELLLKLYDKYRLDFEMFGYTIDKYLDYVH